MNVRPTLDPLVEHCVKHLDKGIGNVPEDLQKGVERYDKVLQHMNIIDDMRFWPSSCYLQSICNELSIDPRLYKVFDVDSYCHEKEMVFHFQLKIWIDHVNAFNTFEKEMRISKLPNCCLIFYSGYLLFICLRNVFNNSWRTLLIYVYVYIHTEGCVAFCSLNKKALKGQ